MQDEYSRLRAQAKAREILADRLRVERDALIAAIRESLRIARELEAGAPETAEALRQVARACNTLALAIAPYDTLAISQDIGERASRIHGAPLTLIQAERDNAGRWRCKACGRLLCACAERHT